MTLPLVVAAITLDFGNTLVRVDRPALRAVVHETAAALARRGIVGDEVSFASVWVEEQERQFREEVPRFREVDLDERVRRVLARLRGMAPPPADRHWDDAAVRTLSEPVEVATAVEWYSDAFVRRMAPVADATATLRRLAADGFSLAILSNWPLARTVDRFAEAQGWLPFLRAVVVSQRVGTIKPHPDIFRAAEEALGLVGRGDQILHVGDDWAADVVGAREAGWRAAYLRDHQADTPLPTSEPGDGVAPPGVAPASAVQAAGPSADLVLDHLADVPPRVRRAAEPPGAAAGT